MLDLQGLLEQFTLGNAAIVTNACLLPLYPGLMAFLAGNANNKRSRSATGWMGILVLAGILTVMILIGVILSALKASFGSVLTFLLPIIYVVVILFGLMMLTGRNPFNRMMTAEAPVLRNPYVTAYVYGLFFGPMTLPCTGPIITTAFLLGASEGSSLVIELVYVIAFGLGFGWPLVVLPLLAMPVQRRIIGWLTKNHDVLNRGSGILLVAVGIFGIITELLPHIISDFTFEQTAQLVYWFIALLITLGVGYWTYRSIHSDQPTKNDTNTVAEAS